MSRSSNEQHVLIIVGVGEGQPYSPQLRFFQSQLQKLGYRAVTVAELAGKNKKQNIRRCHGRASSSTSSSNSTPYSYVVSSCEIRVKGDEACRPR